MKYCGRCGHTLPVGAFTKDRSRPDGLYTICRSCVSKRDKARHDAYRAAHPLPPRLTPDELRRRKKHQQARWHRTNRHVILAHTERRRLEAMAFVWAYKEAHPCPCGEVRPPCLQFHHREPAEKHREVSVMVAMGYALERIQEEIEKCDVLCANCHALEEWHRRNGLCQNSVRGPLA